MMKFLLAIFCSLLLACASADINATNGNENDETQEAQVDMGELGTDPCQGAVGEQVFVDQKVNRYGDQQHKGDRHAQSEAGLYGLRNRQIGTHAQEIGEYHIVDKDRFDEYVKEVHIVELIRETAMPLWSGYYFSCNSGCRLRCIQMTMPTMISAMGGSIMRLLLR